MKSITDLTHWSIITICAIKQRNRIIRCLENSQNWSNKSINFKTCLYNKSGISFINTIMQYTPSTDVVASKYGTKMEPVAFHAFTEYFRLH